MASVGGGYAALMDKGATKVARSNAAPKVKTSKVISLKDTHEVSNKKTPPQGAKGHRSEGAKVQQQQLPPLEKDPARREVQSERVAAERHVPRSGYRNAAGADEDTSGEKVPGSYSERRREFEERDAERKRKEEAELRKVTYAEYQKSVTEKKNELAKLNKSPKERKVDAKRYAKMTEAKKDDGTFMKLSKEGPSTPPVHGLTKGDRDAAPKTPSKKTKFHKASGLELGFYSSSPTKPQHQHQRRVDDKKDSKEGPAAMDECAGAATEPSALVERGTVEGADDEW